MRKMGDKSEQTQTKSSGLFSSLTTLLLVLVLLLVLLGATLIGGLGVVLVGRIITTVFNLSLFEASLISLGTALGIGLIVAVILRPQHLLAPTEEDWDEDYYDEDEDCLEDEFEDKEEKITPPPSRNDPCPCGSGKKYKHCHGKR